MEAAVGVAGRMSRLSP